MTAGFIDEFSETDKDPGFYAVTNFGAGAIAIDDIPLKLLLVGLKATSGGTLTVDTGPRQIFSDTDALTLAGAHSELYRMARAALRVPGLEIWIAAPAAPSGGGAAAATATITIGGTWTTAGTFRYMICGDEISGTIGATDSATNVAARIVEEVMARSHMAVRAANVAGVVTLTFGSIGARGNDGILFQDQSELPSGLTSALAGGAAVTGDGVTGDGVRFTSGVGVETMTTLLGVLEADRWHRGAAAQRDATSLAAWESYIDAKAAYDQGKMEHWVFATNGTQSAAVSLAQTTMNYWRTQMVWQLDGESPPPDVAAVFAAMRTLAEQSTPNVSYSGKALPGIAPQRDKSKWTSRAVRIAVLNDGVTPVNSNSVGEAYIVRSITTRSQTSGGDPDYRTLDSSDSVVPDYVRDVMRLYWLFVFLPANPYVRPDPAPEEPLPPTGVAYPALWNSTVERILLDLEEQLILTQVAANPPRSTFSPTAKRIASRVPVVRLPTQEQMELVVDQLNVA